ncbi:MAG TPA: CHRD domain-containing protein [Candidatus Bathyarchaeia archaeon]|nr:CHRD domain-containing protein [Candidatus Bathyarchaeia archaeon]
MSSKPNALAASVIIGVLGLAVISMADFNNLTIVPPVYAQSQTFTAKLTGNDETPPVSTAATGTAHFQLSSDGKKLTYDLSATNLKGFMMAHIHQGKAGESGQPVVELSMGKGTITSSDLKGPLAGKQISDLVNMIKSGGAYVNVHTQQNQMGEIRGQIMSG